MEKLEQNLPTNKIEQLQTLIGKTVYCTDDGRAVISKSRSLSDADVLGDLGFGRRLAGTTNQLGELKEIGENLIIVEMPRDGEKKEFNLNSVEVVE